MARRKKTRSAFDAEDVIRSLLVFITGIPLAITLYLLFTGSDVEEVL